MNTKERLKAAQEENRNLINKMKEISKAAAHQKRNFTDNELEILDELETDQNLKELEIQQLQKKNEMEKKTAAAAAVVIPGPYGTNPDDVNIGHLILNKAHGRNFSANEKELMKQGDEEAKKAGVFDQPGLNIPSNYFSKAAFTAAGTTSTISTDVWKDISVNIEQSPLKKLGVREIPIKYGQEKLVFSTGATAAFVAEGGNLSDGAPTLSNDQVAPRRCGGQWTYSEEWLASSVPANVSEIIGDAVMSIDRGFFKELITTIVADSNVINASYEAADTGTTLASSDMLTLMSSLTGELDYIKPGISMSKDLFYAFAQTGYLASSVESPAITEEKKFFGWPIVPTSYLPLHDTDKFDVVLGEFASSYAFYYGPVKLLIDPFSSSASGDIVVTFLRLGDISYNPAKFQAGRNFNLS